MNVSRSSKYYFKLFTVILLKLRIIWNGSFISENYLCNISKDRVDIPFCSRQIFYFECRALSQYRDKAFSHFATAESLQQFEDVPTPTRHRVPTLTPPCHSNATIRPISHHHYRRCQRHRHSPTRCLCISASFWRWRCGRGQRRGGGGYSFWGLPGSCANFERKFIASFIICLSPLLLILPLFRRPPFTLSLFQLLRLLRVLLFWWQLLYVLTKMKFCLPNPIKYLVNCANQVVNLMFAKFLIELWINEISFPAPLANSISLWLHLRCLSLSSWLIKINYMLNIVQKPLLCNQIGGVLKRAVSGGKGKLLTSRSWENFWLTNAGS